MDQFTTAFYEALFWSSCDADGDPLEDNFDINSLTNEAKAELDQDCQDFQTDNATLMANLDASQCGHDFALTRNHHGAGFWDRGLGALGEALTKAAHDYGQVDLYEGDDGQLHL